jgi:hypothetical protein
LATELTLLASARAGSSKWQIFGFCEDDNQWPNPRNGGKHLTALQRMLVLVNGRYAATQYITIQEPLVKFGIVP